MLLRRRKGPRHGRREESIPDRFRELFDYRLGRGQGLVTCPEHEMRMIALEREYEAWLTATRDGGR